VRGLAATRQVHTTNMGHSPMFYVAGTLPEFPAVPSFQIGTSLPSYRGSAYLASYLGHRHDHDEDLHEPTPGNGVLAAKGTGEAAPAASFAQHGNGDMSSSADSVELIHEPAAESAPEPRIRPAAYAAKPQSSAKSAPPRRERLALLIPGNAAAQGSDQQKPGQAQGTNGVAHPCRGAQAPTAAALPGRLEMAASAAMATETAIIRPSLPTRRMARMDMHPARMVQMVRMVPSRHRMVGMRGKTAMLLAKA